MLTIGLTSAERKLVSDLLYAKLAQVDSDYHGDNDRRTLRRLRSLRKQVVRIINKFEGTQTDDKTNLLTNSH